VEFFAESQSKTKLEQSERHMEIIRLFFAVDVVYFIAGNILPLFFFHLFEKNIASLLGTIDSKY